MRVYTIIVDTNSFIRFMTGDVHSLPFEDGSFDIVHAHQLIQHIRDPIQGLREMKRVAKPGGLVAVRESASFTWFPETPGLTAWYDLYKKTAMVLGGNPNPGNRIHVWAREAGFERHKIACSAGTWCYAGKDATWWAGVMGERGKRDNFVSLENSNDIVDAINF